MDKKMSDYELLFWHDLRGILLKLLIEYTSLMGEAPTDEKSKALLDKYEQRIIDRIGNDKRIK